MISLSELLSLAKKATGGTWVVSGNFSGEIKAVKPSPDAFDWIIGYMQVSNCPNYEQDANFIAAANPDAIINLVERLQEAEKTLNEIGFEIDPEADGYNSRNVALAHISKYGSQS